MAIGKNIQITVQSIDVDGDGIPDGDLVSKWKLQKDGTRTLVGHKFVSNKGMKAVADKAIVATAYKKQSKAVKAVETKALKTYKGATPPASQSTDPVQVQDKTSFGQYVKLGAGAEVGRIAVDTVANALGDLF